MGRGIALLFHDRCTRRGSVVSSTPWLLFAPGKIRYPFYRRLGGTQGRYGRAENLVPTGIRSWTVQPVVSRYTDWATGPINLYKIYKLKIIFVVDICAVLTFYAAQSDSSVLMFWDNLSFHPQGTSSPILLKMGLLGRPETSVRNCHFMLGRIQKEIM